MLFLLLTLAPASPPAFTVENKCSPDPAFTVTNRCSAPTKAAPAVTVVPPGFHAHTTTDGRTIVHADTNFGNAAAHAGVAYPWPKTATAGQTVNAAQPAVQYALPVSSCPNGQCPAQQTTFFPRRR